MEPSPITCPGSAVVLQDGAKSIWIATLTRKPLQVGDAADATGFPDNHDGFLSLEHGEVRDTLTPAPVTPLAVTWETMSPRGYDSPGHHDDLVSIEGRVETEVREASRMSWCWRLMASSSPPSTTIRIIRFRPPG
jgi:hypothetical protein